MHKNLNKINYLKPFKLLFIMIFSIVQCEINVTEYHKTPMLRDFKPKLQGPVHFCLTLINTGFLRKQSVED